MAPSVRTNVDIGRPCPYAGLILNDLGQPQGRLIVPRPKSALLTEGELRLMQVLWDRGRATVGDVVSNLQGRRTPAYNTVLTMLRILETKGYVRHDKEGRAFVYEPLIDRQQARRSAVKRLIAQFFEGSPGQLVLNLLNEEEIDRKDLQRLKTLVEE
jgi:BlaI family transcriptional regulator, penicillinase repressor